jgi:acetyl-CoA synthetase
MSDQHATIEYLLDENRTFMPPDGFVAQANYADPAVYEKAAADPAAFWAEQAESLSWTRKWDQVLDWNPPFVKWFTGGKLNVAYNCLDRHVEAGHGDKVAYYWEGEPGDTRTITYAELLTEVSKTANALKELGVKKGDRVAVYMPMILEAPIALLACARIGAPHSMVFGGFSAEALRDRINDAQCTVVITADGGYRRGAAAALKPNVDLALQETPSVEKVLVARRTGGEVTMQEGRDVWWDEIVPRQGEECPPEEMDSEDMLYLLYTSGTTAKPKGIVHTTAC